MSLPLPATPEQRRAALDALRYRWTLHARASQLQPEDSDWLIWAIITGRGWGKTRTAAEWVRYSIESEQAGRLHLVARTAADARDTMVEGESGILSISPPWNRPKYEPSKRRITWPNGAMAILFSADEPDALRGPQCDRWWADELASWRYLTETWDMLQMGARLGQCVRGIITSTPRPLKLLKDIMHRDTTRVTRGHTFENAANLAPSFLSDIKDRYEGTRIGRQELAGDILDDDPNALWQRVNIDRDRVTKAPEMARIVVGIDPSCSETGDEAGIVVCG
jgi:phage terminase large subunit-like protein